MIRTTFVMEQHIGHRSFYLNLRRFVEAESTDIEAHWVPVNYLSGDSFWARLPMLSNLAGSVAGRLQARRGLRQKPYDVAFFNTQVPAVLAGSRVRRLPYVVCTDITPLQYDRMAGEYGHTPDRPGSLLARYKQRANERLFRHAARITPWSHWVAESVIQEYDVPSERVVVIPPGVDTEQWRPAERTGNGRPPRILFVGGDLYRKGGALLLKAFAQLPRGSAELILVTRTPVEAPGVETHYGMQPNSPELIGLYQSCDIFVLPTRAEAFGIVALEAGAVGLPTIASNVGGLRDIVVHGETGYLMAADDVDALVHHLTTLLDDAGLRQQMGAANRQRIVTRFDARTNARRTAALLQEVAAEHRKGGQKGL